MSVPCWRGDDIEVVLESETEDLEAELGWQFQKRTSMLTRGLHVWHVPNGSVVGDDLETLATRYCVV